MIARIVPPSHDICEVCFARPAIGTFNVDDVEMAICAYDSTVRSHDGTQVIIPYSC